MKKHLLILLCMCAAGVPAMAAPAPASSLPELQRIHNKISGAKFKSSDSRWSQKRILQLLPHILNGEDVNITLEGMKGNTCLHYACELGSRDLIRWLVENGADVNRVEWGGGNTPLHCSARLASLYSVNYLLEHGANPDIANNEGQRPVDMVGNDDHDAICDALRAAGQGTVAVAAVQQAQQVQGLTDVLTLPQAAYFRMSHRVPLYATELDDLKERCEKAGKRVEYIVPDSMDIEPLYSMEKGEEPIKYRYEISDSPPDEALVVDDGTFLVTCTKASNIFCGNDLRDILKDNDSTINKSIAFWNPHTLKYIRSVMLASNWQNDWKYSTAPEQGAILFSYEAETSAGCEADASADAWLGVDLHHSGCVKSFYGWEEYGGEIGREYWSDDSWKPGAATPYFSADFAALIPRLIPVDKAQLNLPGTMRKKATMQYVSHDFLHGGYRSIRELDFSTLTLHPLPAAKSIDAEAALAAIPRNRLNALAGTNEQFEPQSNLTGNGTWLSVTWNEGAGDEYGVCLFHPDSGELIPLGGLVNTYSQASSEFIVDNREADVHPITCKLNSSLEGFSNFEGYHAAFVYHKDTGHYTFLLTDADMDAITENKHCAATEFLLHASESRLQDASPPLREASQILRSRLNPHIVIKGHGQEPRGTLMSIMNHRPGKGRDAYYWLAAEDGICSLVEVDFATHKGEVLEHWEGAWRRQLKYERQCPEQPVWLEDRRWLCLPYKPHCWKVLQLDETSLKTNLLCYVYLHGKRDFAIVLPNGLYAGSPGCESFLFVERDGRQVGMAPFAAWRNRPAEVLRALGGNADDIAALEQTTARWRARMGIDENTPEPTASDLPELSVQYPDVTTSAASCSFPVSASGSNNAPCTVIVQADGSKVLEFNLQPGESQTAEVPLAPGVNWVEVTPRNAVTGLAGDTTRFRVIRNGLRGARLHVVAVGVSEYANPDFRLQYAAKDAGDIAEGFGKWGGHGCRVLCLRDGEVQKTTLVQRIRDFLSGAAAEDCVVVYCAGHGMLDESFAYHFAPSDFDVSNISGSGVSMDELQEAMLTSPARNRLLLLDTCHAGILGEEGEEKLALANGRLAPGVRAIQNRGMKVQAATGMNNTQKKRYIEELFSMGAAQRGISIIAGSAGAEYALESDNWNNGVFTAAVLQAISGMADDDMDGWLSIAELADYVTRKVQEATGGAQKPSVSAMENSGETKLFPNAGAFIYQQDWSVASAMLKQGNKLNDAESAAPYSWIGLAIEKNAPVSLLQELVDHGAATEKTHFSYWGRRALRNKDEYYYYYDDTHPYIDVSDANSLHDNEVPERYIHFLAPFVIKHQASLNENVTLRDVFKGTYIKRRYRTKELNRARQQQLYEWDKERLQSALSRAKKAKENSLAAQLQHILKGGEVDAPCGDASGNTALINAAYKGDWSLVCELLSLGADSEARNKEGWNALTIAAFKGRTECVKGMLNTYHPYIDSETRTASGSTPLMLAAMSGHLDTLKLLIAEHADIHATNPDGYTALDLAEQKGQTEAAKYLRAQGAK